MLDILTFRHSGAQTDRQSARMWDVGGYLWNKTPKQFQYHLCDIERVRKYSWVAISLANNFEIIPGKFPRAEIKLFQADVDKGRNIFEIIIFHM